MFRLGKSPVPIELGQVDKAVIDEERRAWLRFEQSTGSEPGSVFRLTWEHRVIAFEAVVETLPDVLTGDHFLLYRFVTFGGSGFTKIPIYKFTTQNEADAAMLLAAEALIVFGGFYNGDVAKDGAYRVALNDRIYKRSDFKMT